MYQELTVMDFMALQKTKKKARFVQIKILQDGQTLARRWARLLPLLEAGLACTKSKKETGP